MKDTSSLPSFTSSPLQSADFLPMPYKLALKTWFSADTLKAAHALIQKQQIQSFFYFRSDSGLIAGDDIIAAITCRTGKTGQQPFVFRDGWCSSCVATRYGHRCKHVAALALLTLRERHEKLHPVSLEFENSPWHKTGMYLCQRLSGGQPEITWRQKGKNYRLQVRKNKNFLLQVQLSPAAVREIKQLGIAASPDKNLRQRFQEKLITTLVERTCTKTEQELLARGRTGKKLHQDTSGWMWLCRLLFLHHPIPSFHLITTEQGLYQLQSDTDGLLFSLTLPRRHTWELLSSLGPEQFGIRQVSRAEQFSKVFFDKQGDTITVESWCRLHNGKEHSLTALEKQRFGNHYFMDNIVFSLKPIPADEKIEKRKRRKTTMPLFDFAAAEQEKENSFTIAREEIPDFLELNNSALNSARHKVDRQVINLDIVNEPDSLELTENFEDMDWCYLAGYYRVGNRKIQLHELLQAAADNKRFIPGHHWFDLEDSPLHWFHSLGRDRLLEDGRVKLTRQELLLLGCQLPRITATGGKRKEKDTISFVLRQDNDFSPLAKGTINKHLRSYQVHGVHWLTGLHRYGLGGILADDMGLGKTHQALALAELITDRKNEKNEKNEKNSILIVCPAAVLYHWPEKQGKFFPNLSLDVYYGPERDFSTILKNRIIVTTYGVLRRDISLLAHHSFKLIIFDEMHALKNKKTVVYDAARQLAAESIFGLSGTPIENSIEEVQALLELCLPGLFTSRPVRQIFKKNKTKKQRRLIRKIIHPFILRRTREQVLTELPARSEDIRLCQLHADQITPYRQAVEQAGKAIKQLENDTVLPDFTHILTTIIRLKQICNHLCLLKGCTDWQRYHSGKWEEFTRLTNQCLEAGHKVVVFSQFTSMLDLIEGWLNSRNIDHVSLRGNVAAKKRALRIKRFNSTKKCRVCCASLLAGGTGIDLTGAQVVIHYDRWWNPAKEEQATARVHRMGQKHPVQVYKLITIGTLEEKIHRLIEEKKNLAGELITEDEGSILKKLDRKELADLFRLN